MRLPNGNISHRPFSPWVRMLACYLGIAFALTLAALAFIGF
jgi:hypothetical protein